MKKFLLLGLILLIACALAPAQTVDEIIQKNLEAKGGIDKISAIKSGKATGKMLNQGMEMGFTMWFKKPDKIRMELSFSGKQMIFAYDGNVAWQISPFTGSTDPQEMTGEMAENIKENIETLNDPFIDYEKKGHKIEFIGKDELEGTDVLKLKITLKSGKENTIFIDAETFIELKTASVRTMDNGQEISTETVHGDYKPVAGVMMAHSMGIVTNGQKSGEMIFELIEPNAELENDTFSMPPKKAEKEVKKEEKKEE